LSDKLVTRASSINRALDQVGDKWCVLIIQEVFWGIHSFNDMMATIGVSRGVLADRLKWLQGVECLRKAPAVPGGRRMRYYLTEKSMDLYHCALMGHAWEQRFCTTAGLDDVQLIHHGCGSTFTPKMCCRHCDAQVQVWDVSYTPGPGATRDERDKKVRRRSSIPVEQVPSERSVYRNLVNILGDRWTANVLALAFHGLHRFDQFHGELPIATNILSDRLRFLVEQGLFEQRAYQEKPLRYEYHLTAKGEALYPYFLGLLQWGDKWCDPGGGRPMDLVHTLCGQPLHGEVRCSECGDVLHARQVAFRLGNTRQATA
jgi:DNA-binding HxlR family transcriptional regulator